MRLLTPKEVAELTGLPYAKALKLVKCANHVQIGNCYYISETALRTITNPDTAIMIKEEDE